MQMRMSAPLQNPESALWDNRVPVDTSFGKLYKVSRMRMTTSWMQSGTRPLTRRLKDVRLVARSVLAEGRQFAKKITSRVVFSKNGLAEAQIDNTEVYLTFEGHHKWKQKRFGEFAGRITTTRQILEKFCRKFIEMQALTNQSGEQLEEIISDRDKTSSGSIRKYPRLQSWKRWGATVIDELNKRSISGLRIPCREGWRD